METAQKSLGMRKEPGGGGELRAWLGSSCGMSLENSAGAPRGVFGVLLIQHDLLTSPTLKFEQTKKKKVKKLRPCFLKAAFVNQLHAPRRMQQFLKTIKFLYGP